LGHDAPPQASDNAHSPRLLTSADRGYSLASWAWRAPYNLLLQHIIHSPFPERAVILATVHPTGNERAMRPNVTSAKGEWPALQFKQWNWFPTTWNRNRCPNASPKEQQ